MRHASLTDSDRIGFAQASIPLPPAEAVLHKTEDGMRFWTWKPEQSLDQFEAPEFRWIHYPAGHRLYPSALCRGTYTFAVIGSVWKWGKENRFPLYQESAMRTAAAYGLTTER